MYNYFESVKNDVLDAIETDYNFADFDSLDDFEERLNDDLWIDDSVTGNASGSYTFNAYEAEKNLAGNWDLLEEALIDFGYESTIDLEKGPEYYDVTIRCYLLGSAISAALDEIKDDFEEAIFIRDETEREESEIA